MSSPAELLAQQHRAASATPEPTASSSIIDSDVSDTESTSESVAESTSKSSVTPSKKLNIYDTTAFPSLGKSNGSSSNNASTWGANNATNGWSSAVANDASSSKAFKPAVKSSTTQLTFIIDDDQQKNLAQAERFKITSNIMSIYDVKIESTHSSTTKKRTFLLSGKNEKVQIARKQILKQITKPTELEFTIPSKMRSIVIGPRGKNLNPIIELTGVKIDIEKNTEDDDEEFVPSNEEEELFGKSLKVNIVGDIEGCQEAKEKILAIVNSQTKSLSVRIPIPANIKQFVPTEIEQVKFPEDIEIVVPDAKSKASNIIISGPRESIVESRNQIKNLLIKIEKGISSTKKNIPRQFHDLVNVDEILKESNVVVEFPEEESASDIVTFIGSATNVAKAIDLARKMTSESVTDTLNLAKSHGNNVEHAKIITAFFVYTKFFDAVSSEFNVKIKAPSYKALANPENESVLIIFTTSKDNASAIKSARKLIVETVNKITPSFVTTITDIESFLFTKLDNSTAIEENVAVVPLGSLAGFGNALFLVVQQSDDEFLPSTEEINDRLNKVESSFSKVKELSASLIVKTIELGSEEQKHLEGNSLNVLLNKFEPNSIEIKLHQNAEGASENEIFLRGYKSVINEAIDQINQLIEDVKNYEEASKYNITMEIPSKYLARFIGQKGSHLNELSDDFDVKIDVLSQKDDSNEETDVKLTGLKSNVDELTKKVHSLIKKWSDEVSLIMNVDPKYHKLLVGPNGIYINRLQNKYNVRIQLPDNNTETKKSDVLIRGPSRGVAKTEEEIKMLMDYEKENGLKQEIEVSREALGSIIGRKGETLNDISADTGANIQVGTAAEGAELVTLTITGSKAGIAQAIEKIRAIEKRVVNFVTETIEVDSKWYRTLIGPSGLNKREIMIKAGGDENDRDFRRLLQFPGISEKLNTVKCEGDKAVVTKIIARVQELVAELESIVEEKIEIPKNLHRFLIGPSGSTKNAVESEFNVKIFIPSKNSESCDISIKGKPENIAAATKKLHELVEGKK